MHFVGDSGIWISWVYSNINSSFFYGDRGTSVVSDELGNLLLYTNGEHICNANHDTLPNCNLNGHNGSIGSLIVPRPDHPNNYYVIVAGFRYFFTKLQYSEVDLTLDNGLGDVISGQANITLNNNVTERVTAVRHANGRDIWLLAHEIGNNNFVAYLVSPDGIHPNPVISNIGAVHQDTSGTDMWDSVVKGEMKFSPCGRRLAVAIKGLDLVQLFDFDTETGQLSNPNSFNVVGAHSVEFSSDGNLLHVAPEERWGTTTALDTFNVLQYNLLDNYQSLSYSPLKVSPAWTFGNSTPLQLAWNDKIYIGFKTHSGIGPDPLSILLQPHLLGDSSQFLQSPYFWPSSMEAPPAINGLPNFFRSYLDKNVFATNVCLGDTTMFHTKNSYLFDSIRWEITDPVTGLHTYSNVDTVYHVYSQPGEYNVHVLRYRSTFVDDFVKKHQVYPFVTFIGQDTSLCGGGQTQLAVNSPWCSVTWYNDYGLVSTNNNISVSSDGNYWPEVTNFWQTCGEQLDTVSVNLVDFNLSFVMDTLKGNCLGNQYVHYPYGSFTDAESYLWNTGYTGFSLQAPVSGLYTLTVSGHGCSESASIYALYDEPLVVNLGEDIQVCDSTTLQANVQATAYLWQPNGDTTANTVATQSGVYYLAASNVCGTFTDSVDVEIVPTPQNINIPDTAFCSGNNIVISPNIAMVDYLWSTGDSSDSILINSEGFYGVSVSNQCGQASSSFYATEEFPFSLSLEDTMYLSNDSIMINGGYPANYQWSNGSTETYIWVADSGLYSVTASNACNTVNDSVMVLNPLGVANSQDVATNIRVFPNPVKDILMVDLSEYVQNSMGHGTISLQVLDCIGKELLTMEIYLPNGRSKINLSSYPDGIYYLLVKQGQYKQCFKLIKSN